MKLFFTGLFEVQGGVLAAETSYGKNHPIRVQVACQATGTPRDKKAGELETPRPYKVTVIDGVNLVKGDNDRPIIVDEDPKDPRPDHIVVGTIFNSPQTPTVLGGGARLIQEDEGSSGAGHGRLVLAILPPGGTLSVTVKGFGRRDPDRIETLKNEGGRIVETHVSATKAATAAAKPSGERW